MLQSYSAWNFLYVYLHIYSCAYTYAKIQLVFMQYKSIKVKYLHTITSKMFKN